MKKFSEETLLANLTKRYRYLNDKDATANKVYQAIIDSQKLINKK
jgi:hypothetical protein